MQKAERRRTTDGMLRCQQCDGRRTKQSSIVERRSSLPEVAVVLATILFIAFYSHYALLKYDVIMSGVGVDLANLNQTVWATVAGHPYHMTTVEGITSRLGLHVEPILLAMVPFYALVPSPKTLILVQVVAIGLVALPLYDLTRTATGRPWLAIAFPILYLLSPSTSSTALAGFYPVALGALPALAAMAALLRKREKAAMLFALIALLCREDYGLWLAGFSVLAWWQTRRRVWLLGVVAGAGWFLVAIQGIMPRFVEERQAIYWTRYGFWLEGPEAWVAYGLLDVKAGYLLGLAAMGGILAVLAPVWALPAMHTLTLNLLSNFALPVSFDSYYSSLVVPTLLAAGAVGLVRLPRRWQSIAVGLLLITGFGYHRVEARSPVVAGFRLPEYDAHSASFPDIARQIPPEAGLAASTHLMPHVSARTVITPLWNQDVDVLLIDVLRDLDRNPLITRDRVFTLLSDGWGVRTAGHGYLLLERGGTQKEIPEAFYTFATPEGPPAVTTDIVFGDTFQLVGYDIRWDYWGRPAPRLYWRALHPVDRDWQLFVSAVDSRGDFISTPDTHPPITQLWWPPSRWQAGNRYVVEMLPFDAPQRWRLAVGVGNPWTDETTRLSTGDGEELITLTEVVRRGRGWHSKQ